MRKPVLGHTTKWRNRDSAQGHLVLESVHLITMLYGWILNCYLRTLTYRPSKLLELISVSNRLGIYFFLCCFMDVALWKDEVNYKTKKGIHFLSNIFSVYKHLYRVGKGRFTFVCETQVILLLLFINHHITYLYYYKLPFAHPCVCTYIYAYYAENIYRGNLYIYLCTHTHTHTEFPLPTRTPVCVFVWEEDSEQDS